MASGQISQVSIKQIPIPGVPYDPTPYTNNSNVKGVGLYLGGGYQWVLSPHWSWSLGGRVTYYDFTKQKGHYTVGGPGNYSYNYDINAFVINTVLHINWNISLRNTLYGETIAGIANLSSQNGRVTDSSISGVEYINKTTNNFDYGFAVGWMYRLTKKTSFDIVIGYQNLGEASLGGPVFNTGAISKGDIKQKLRGLNARVGLVHWF